MGGANGEVEKYGTMKGKWEKTEEKWLRGKWETRREER